MPLKKRHPLIFKFLTSSGAMLVTLFLLLIPSLIPSNFIFSVWELQYIPQTEFISQGRTVLFSGMVGDYQATIKDIYGNPVCGVGSEYKNDVGAGRWTYLKNDDDAYNSHLLNLNNWTADPDCTKKLKQKEIYIAKATWSFGFWFYSWTIHKKSDPFIYNPDPSIDFLSERE